MKAFLLDRDGRYPDEPDRIPDLLALPAALGLTRKPDVTTVRPPEDAWREGGGR
jgi:hypothetical protein